MSYHLIIVSMLSILTLVKVVAKNVVMKETMIPTAVTINGKYVASSVVANS
jgi:hypothetical protein